MAIVKATYTKSKKGAKASLRYIQHRPGKDGERLTRTLFGSEGKMERTDAYRLIDEAQRGSVFFRFVISPDPAREDSAKDLWLRDITDQTMQTLAERLKTSVTWVASIHADHTPHRHVHVIAVVNGRLFPQDFVRMRERATDACLVQRRERDLAHDSQLPVLKQRGEQEEDTGYGV
jgi:type IV secretory pathway VirD2 relaxase